MPRFTPRFRRLYYPAYYEDPDICFRAGAAGYEVLYVPSAKAVHVGNSVIGHRSLAHYLAHHRNRFRFVLAWLNPEAVGSGFVECETWLARHVTDPVEREALRRLYRANSRRAGAAGRVFLKLYSEMLSAPDEADSRAAFSALESDSWQPAERWLASRHAR
jgi:GT2 family glycosyltransferase